MIILEGVIPDPHPFLSKHQHQKTWRGKYKTEPAKLQGVGQKQVNVLVFFLPHISLPFWWASYLTLGTHTTIRAVVLSELIFHFITYLYGYTSHHQREAKKAVSTEHSVSDSSHFTTQKPQVIPSHCIQAQHCSEAVPSRETIADAWLATNLQHHSAGADTRRRHRVHFKHTYTSWKTNECFSQGRKKLFYSSLAPPHPLKLEHTENAFSHG